MSVTHFKIIFFLFYRAFDKAILIVRNPLLAALSDFHRTKSGKNRHISHADPKHFEDKKKWHQFATKFVSKWKWFFNVIFKRYDAKKFHKR